MPKKTFCNNRSVNFIQDDEKYQNKPDGVDVELAGHLSQENIELLGIGLLVVVVALHGAPAGGVGEEKLGTGVVEKVRELLQVSFLWSRELSA